MEFYTSPNCLEVSTFFIYLHTVFILLEAPGHSNLSKGGSLYIVKFSHLIKVLLGNHHGLTWSDHGLNEK